MIRGFDVSGFQGSTIPACDFVFVKATEGASYTSGSFAAQWASAKQHAHVRGAYHFARPEESSAASQADRLIAAARPRPGEMLCLDLEASKLGQAATNAWARAFGDRLRAKAPGVRTVLYMGSGYATSATGKGLADHFDLWWYPQYPSTARTSTWPTAFTPWLPSGIAATGWAKPHIWQWTDNLNGLDASISTLTLDQLAGGGQPTPPPQEDTMLSGSFTGGKGEKPPIVTKGGNFGHIFVGWDNTRESTDLGITREAPAKLRFAPHIGGRKGETIEVTVGAPLDDTKGRPDGVETALPAGCDYIAVEREDDGTRPVGFSVY